MKKIFLLFLLPLLLFGACDEDSKDVSSVTHFVTISLDGSEIEQIPLGGSYVEPGYTAMEGDNDVTSSVIVTDNIDPSKVGIYSVLYNINNQDGFSSSEMRRVVVYDPSALDVDISGTYDNYILRTSETSVDVERSLEVTFTMVAPGVFHVDCLLGNYYSIGSGYGPSYLMDGYLQLNNDYTFTLLYSYIDGWGDGLDGIQNGFVDQVTLKPYWEALYAQVYNFKITCK